MVYICDYFPVMALAERGMMGTFRRRFCEFPLEWEALCVGVWGEWGCWAKCHVENAFPSFLLVEALCRCAGSRGGAWVAARCGYRAAPDTPRGSCGEPRSSLRVCLSELTVIQGFAWDAEPLQAGCCFCVLLPQCCWPIVVPCSSEYDFEICHDESKLVRPAGRFHSWSPLQKMLSLNYAQEMDFQVVVFSFFFFPQYCCLKIQLQMFCIQKDLVQPLQSRDE